MDYPGGPNGITGAPIRGRGECTLKKKKRFEDVTLLGLKTEDEATSQGKQAVSRSWKGERNRVSTRASRENMALPTP